MSHGGGSEVCNPNLTPMLDMVLQLVMFFMLVANFVMQDLTEDIKLPDATTAIGLDRSVSDMLFLNVDRFGALLPTDGDRQPIKSPAAIQQYMNRRYQTQVSLTDAATAKKMTVIIRADQGVRFEKVFLIMKAARQVGFEKIQLRAIAKNK